MSRGPDFCKHFCFTFIEVEILLKIVLILSQLLIYFFYPLQSMKALLKVVEEGHARFMVLAASQIFLTPEGLVHTKTFSQPGPNRK